MVIVFWAWKPQFHFSCMGNITLLWNMKASVHMFNAAVMPHLWHREMRLSRQAQFLLLWRVSVEAMLVQPVSQNLNGFFGEVSPAAAFGGRPAASAAAGQTERVTVIFTRVAVRHGRKLWSALVLLKNWDEDDNRSIGHKTAECKWFRVRSKKKKPQMCILCMHKN